MDDMIDCLEMASSSQPMRIVSSSDVYSTQSPMNMNVNVNMNVNDYYRSNLPFHQHGQHGQRPSSPFAGEDGDHGNDSTKGTHLGRESMEGSHTLREELTGFVSTVVHRASGTLYSVFVFWDGQRNEMMMMSGSEGKMAERDNTSSAKHSQEGSNTSLDRLSTFRPSIESHLDSLSASTYIVDTPLNPGEGCLLSDVYAGLIRVEPSYLVRARFAYFERTTVQDLRICVYQPKEREMERLSEEEMNHPAYRVTSVWTIQGELDAVALTQMKMRVQEQAIGSRHPSPVIQFQSIPVGIFSSPSSPLSQRKMNKRFGDN